MTPRSEGALLERVRARDDRRRLVGAVFERLVLPRLRADALVGQGPGAAASSSMPRWRCGRGEPAAQSVALLLESAAAARPDCRPMRSHRWSSTFRARHDCIAPYRDAYARYCWPVAVRERPATRAVSFAGGGRARLHAPGPCLAHADAGRAGRRRKSRPHGHARTSPSISNDSASAAAATRWWEEHTAAGGEGMVVKPLEWIVRGSQGPGAAGDEVPRAGIPADHLRPGVHAAASICRACGSGRPGAKRSLAAREFALGLEALERFVRREPLRRVHECVFGVLALESEPVDPRL